MTPFHWITEQMIKSSNEDKALEMKAYMKNHFDFYGINAPSRKDMVRSFKVTFDLKNPDENFWKLIELLWLDYHRECQYIAIDLMQSISVKIPDSRLPFLERLILTKSWWDTVDGIAPALVGDIFKRFPATRQDYIYKWMDSDNIWLQRSAIIFQLKYGKDTDWDLLCEAILKHETSSEFFIRKAQGWALRQYSRYEPAKVYEFVQANPQLSGLTKKEAFRNIIH